MAIASPEKTWGNYIGGEWVASESGKTFESRNPANTNELIGEFAASTKADVDARHSGRDRCRGQMARHHRHRPRRHLVQSRRNPRLPPGRCRPRACARRRQNPQGRRRRNRPRRPDPALLRRRHPATRRRALSIRQSGHPALHHPRAARRRRGHHPLELPDRDPGLEDRSSHRLRQHRRVQTRQRHPAAGSPLRRSSGRRRTSGGGRSISSPAALPPSATRWSRTTASPPSPSPARAKSAASCQSPPPSAARRCSSSSAVKIRPSSSPMPT